MKRLLSAVLTLALLLIFVTPQARAGGQTKGCIALTFDDGPSGELTERLLDGLRARGIHATFFVCGYRVAQYPQTLCRIAERATRLGCTAAAMIICTKCPAKPYTTIWSPAWRP